MSAKINLDFELSFFEGLSKRQPKDFKTLEILAELYTRAGRVSDGLRIDRRLVRLRPDHPTAHYNLACSLALKDRKKEATEALETAIELGYHDLEWIEQDGDFKAMRGYKPFERLLERLRRE